MIKQAVALLLLVTMTLTALPAALAAEQQEENRVYYNRTYDEPGVDAFTGASVAAKSNTIVAETEDDGNGFIHFIGAQEQTEDFFLDVSMDNPPRYLVVEAALSADEAGITGNIQFKDEARKDGVILEINSSGAVLSPNSGEELGRLEPGKWLNVAIALDLESFTYSSYVDGKQIEQDLPIKGQAVGMTVIRVYFGSQDNSGKDLKLDNFRIYEAQEPIDPSELPAIDNEEQQAENVLNTPSPTPVTELFGTGAALLVDSPAAYANQTLTQVDTENDSVVPVIQNDRTLVPVRFLAESFGASVGWDEATGTVTVDSGDKHVTLVLGADHMDINGQSVALEVPAQTIHDRTMLPLRAVAEAIDKNVFWDDRGLILVTDLSRPIDAVADSRVVDGMLSMLRYGYIDTRYNQSPRFTQSIIDEAIEEPLIRFTGSRNSANVGWGNLEQKSSKAMYYLTLAAYLNEDAVSSQTGKKGSDRVVEHLRNLIAGGNEPFCCVGPYLGHSEISSVILLASRTPQIWDQLTGQEIDRLEWLMRGLAIAGNWGFNDRNNYTTGFDLTGNFDKNWNPNYRNTYLPVIGNACLYFGAEELDEIFTSFDYDAYISKYTELGFTNILASWTVAGKELMENGGAATLTEEYGGGSGGSGAGVKIPFVYNGYGLDELAKIAQTHIAYTYSSDVVDSAGTPGTDAYAYIVTGKSSPYLGLKGMMFEFVSGDAGGLRSSASYCHASQVTLFPYLMNLILFDVWDSTKNEEQAYIDKLIYVGNEDVIFKLEQGYSSYMKGSSSGVEYEVTFAPKGYAMDKEIWRKVMQFAGGDTTLSQKPDAVAAAEPKDGITHAPEGALSGVLYEGTIPADAFIELKQDGVTQVSFDLNLDADVTFLFDGVIGLSADRIDKAGYGDIPILLQMRTETINAMDGTAYQPSELPVAANYKYHVELTIDPEKATYTAAVTPTYPEAGSTVKVADSFAFRESAGAVDAIRYLVLVRADAGANYWLENLTVS